MSPDSIIPNPNNPQDFNRYSYPRNNPLKFTDLTGHSGGLNDFFLGVVSEITNNNYDALFVPPDSPLRPHAADLVVSPESNVAFQTGRAVGALGNVVQGVAEIYAGIGLAGGSGLGGLATAPSGVGALAGTAGVVAGGAVAMHGGMAAGNGAVGLGDAGGNILNAIFGRGSGPNRPITLNTAKGSLLSSQNKGDTKNFLKQSWYKGSFKTELDSAAYHLNQHGRGMTIQEYTREAQDFFGKYRYEGIKTVDKEGIYDHLITITNEVGFGRFTPDGKVVTYQAR